MFLLEGFRWYGPQDQVPLAHVRQTGATQVVSSLHHLKPGEVWPVDEIKSYQKIIADAGLTWSVVESLPVSEDIKTNSPLAAQHLKNYRQSLKNLASCNIKTIVYNFMPVLDWVRTDLNYQLPDGSRALYFAKRQFAAFELFILQRPNAEADYSANEFAAAKGFFDNLDAVGKAALERNIIDNFPGFKGVTLADVRNLLAKYRMIDRPTLEQNLQRFLTAVCPLADELGMRLGMHPDDPPFPILGLPRIFSTLDDVKKVLKMYDGASNGVNFCAGSFSARCDNDVVAMFKACADRVNFVHLRSTAHDAEGNFYEANHLEGSVDMYNLLQCVIAEQIRRRQIGREDWRLTFRPDHGHTMLDDLDKPQCANPGYTAIGRLKGLAELRGLEYGILRSKFEPSDYKI